MAEETKIDYVDTGLTFKGFPVLLGARKFTDGSKPQFPKGFDLTRLDRCLFQYIPNLYEGACDLNHRETLVEGALPWPEGKGPRSLRERAVERAHEFVEKCLEEKKAKRQVVSILDLNMDRRTFLKAVFAASVAPASCVKALYQPEIPFGIDYWIRVQPVLHEELKAALFRMGIVKMKPDTEKIFFKGVPLEFKPNLGETDDEIYISNP